ncbi:sporulation protein [Jeotgalibacillus sp. S-D1]|uniref:sporulation protein n=1 Tax=Jeotgalibacillus sp. S-D1 TaxID=2552189 RepID=UPI0010598C9C|nr:sporulation protein [Jeotgalibacillus sp. S-D1]TDL35298.1 sporulation protein [Jeotgalibacillus sp. S-D1]
MKICRLGLLMMIILLLGGCAVFQKVGPAEMIIHDGHKDLVSSIKQQIEDTDEIYDTVVIAAKDKILVTYKVRHLNRFKMKSIEKKLTTWLKDEFPDKDVDVSSDFKIFLESYNLYEQWEKKELTGQEAEKKLYEIIHLKNEMT